MWTEILRSYDGRAEFKAIGFMMIVSVTLGEEIELEKRKRLQFQTNWPLKNSR